MAGPFHLLLLIMLVMMCTTAGQPTGVGASSEGSKPKTGATAADDWEKKRKALLRPKAKARYGSGIVIESLDLLESPCAAPVLVANRGPG
jgi:hypothetical protein